MDTESDGHGVFESLENASIDEEIKRLSIVINRASETIIRLKVSRNSNLPVFRLPPEILTSIFLHYVVDGATTFDYSFDPSSPNCWINVTHVCHHWREVALSCSKLWSHWGALGKYWFRLFSSRSKMAPLYIRSSHRHTYITQQLVNFLQVPGTWQRVKELHLSNFYSNLEPVFGRLIDPPDPDGIAQKHTWLIHSLRFNNAMPLPKALLQFQFPHLRRLELCACSFDWNSPVFESSGILTHLVLYPPVCQKRPTMQQFIYILKSQPLLEELFLGHTALPLPAEEAIAPVNLSRLREIRLNGPLKDCLGLNANIIYPQAEGKTMLGFTSNYEDFTSHVASFCPGSKRRDGNDSSATMIRRLSLHKISPLDLSIWTYSESEGSHASSPSFTIKLDWVDWPLQRPTPKCVFAAFPLQNLCSLTIDDIIFTADHWRREIFPFIINLEELVLNGTSSIFAVTALKPELATTDEFCDKVLEGEPYQDKFDQLFTMDSNDWPVISLELAKSFWQYPNQRTNRYSYIPVPHLTTLRISHVDVWERSADNLLMDELLLCLEARKQADCTLQNLVLRSCWNLEGYNCDIYERSVEHVSWDGYEKFYTDLYDPDRGSMSCDCGYCEGKAFVI